MKLKDFFINGKIVGSGGSSLPPFITLIQYHNTWSDDAHTGKWPNDKPWNTVDDHGTMGNSYYAYSVDCKHKFLKAYNTEGTDPVLCETESFQWLNDIFLELRMPIVKKSELESRFHIIEIPDYGHQAMSEFYRDFIVLVYNTDGQKIPQKYVGIIRSFVNKTAYILIDKSTKLITTSVAVKIVFKNNVEEELASSAEFVEGNKIPLKVSTTPGEKFQNTKDSCAPKYISASVELDLEIMDFGSLDDYTLFIETSTKSKKTGKVTTNVIECNNIYNNKFIRDVTVYPNNIRNVFPQGINTTTVIEDGETKEIDHRDYFKQAFEYDYLGNKKEVYTRSSVLNKKITININTNIPESYLTRYNPKMYLMKNSRFYDFIIFSGSVNILENFSLVDLYPHNISIYDITTGDKEIISRNNSTIDIEYKDNGDIYINSSNNSKYYEIIPEFRNVQKMQMVDNININDDNGTISYGNLIKSIITKHRLDNINDTVELYIDNKLVITKPDIESGKLSNSLASMENKNIELVVYDCINPQPDILSTFSSIENANLLSFNSVKYSESLKNHIIKDTISDGTNILFDKNNFWYDSDEIEINTGGSFITPIYTVDTGKDTELITNRLIDAEKALFNDRIDGMKKKISSLNNKVKEKNNRSRVPELNRIRKKIFSQLNKKSLKLQNLENIDSASNDYILVVPNVNDSITINLAACTKTYEGTSGIWSSNGVVFNIDATSSGAKFKNNDGGWIQLNAGTTISFKIPDSIESIDISVYENKTENITITRENGIFTISVNTNNTYINKITLNYRPIILIETTVVERSNEYATTTGTGFFQEYHMPKMVNDLVDICSEGKEYKYISIVIPYWRYFYRSSETKIVVYQCNPLSEHKEKISYTLYTESI